MKSAMLCCMQRVQDLERQFAGGGVERICFIGAVVSQDTVDAVRQEQIKSKGSVKRLEVLFCSRLHLNLLDDRIIAPRLEELELKVSEFRKENLSKLACGLALCSRLRSLCLVVTKNELSDWNVLVPALAKCSQTLENFRLWGYNEDDMVAGTVVQPLLSALSSGRKLEKLQLDNCRVSKGSVELIKSMCCSGLRYLSLSFDSKDKELLLPLVQLLPRVKSLQTLRLSSNGNTDNTKLNLGPLVADALSDTDFRIGNTSITRFYSNCVGNSCGTIQFYASLNRAGFRGNLGGEMTSERWFAILKELLQTKSTSIGDVRDDSLGSVYYFLRYQPDWLCATDGFAPKDTRYHLLF